MEMIVNFAHLIREIYFLCAPCCVERTFPQRLEVRNHLAENYGIFPNKS